jgi:hypothetical protein
VGWVLLFAGLLVPLAIGAWLIRSRGADLLLSLLGLASVPVLVWAGSLGAKIGPCKVGNCMSSGQHSHLVIGLVALGILLVSFGLLAVKQTRAGGAVLVVSQLVGAFSMTRTDTAAAVMLLIFALAAAGYMLATYLAEREARRVPDFPPV